MDNTQTICLLNDSFPPLIDGVANTVVNYAKHLPEEGLKSLVITPDRNDAEDQKFDYPVIRYPSIKTQMVEGYPAGVPFSPKIARATEAEKITLLHSHCPVVSTLVARELRQIKEVPIVMTYHTKFDIDIAHIVKNAHLREVCKKVLLSNISACDEIWAVSKGAGENLRALGYEGDYIVMPNGVDLPRERASAQKMDAVTGTYDLPRDVPVYLFVGRMMWYKGIRIILDALAKMKIQSQDFRMVFIGDGDDRQDIEQYAEKCSIADRCIFTGVIHDRAELQAWYTRANLFLFPSTYDTNGLVVREAAACSLASVLIRGSCAAEGITDRRNGFLIEENPESLAACLSSLSRDTMRCVGEAAGNELYLSWADAVKMAAERYRIVIDRYRCGYYPRHRKPSEAILKMNGEIMEALAKISKLRHDK